MDRHEEILRPGRQRTVDRERAADELGLHRLAAVGRRGLRVRPAADLPRGGFGQVVRRHRHGSLQAADILEPIHADDARMGVAGHGVDLAIVGLHDAALIVLHGQPHVAQIHLARRPLGHRPAPQSVPLRTAEYAADQEAVGRVAEPVALVAVGEEVFLVSQLHAADRKVLLVEHAGRTFEAELAAIVALVAGELVEILPQLRLAVRGDEPCADHEDATVRRAPEVLRPTALAMRVRLKGL